MDSKKIVRATPKPLLLKDFLLDDFSSCSSNGFRSYPRRQCCSTVRFLVEIDMNKNKKQGVYKKTAPKLIKNTKNIPKSSSPSSQKLSTFQKASLAVINALKHFPFPKSLSTKTQTKTKLALLPRTLSKKLLKRAFWKKSDIKEIEPVKKEVIVVVDTTGSISDSSKKSDSWSGSDFTVTSTSEDGNHLDKNGAKNDVVSSVGEEGELMDETPTTTTMSSDTNSITNSEKAWTNEEKEQFSPVSILDCPFDDEDEVSSPFSYRFNRAEGATQKRVKLERLGQVQPMNLEKKITEYPNHITTSESEQENFIVDETEEEECVEQEALNLLQLIKATNPSYNSILNADKLVSDFFRERLAYSGCGHGKINGEVLLDEAIDWIDGSNNWVSMWDWKVQKNRLGYIRVMEMSGEWKSLDEEIEEIALELETKVFDYVMDEVIDTLVE